MTEETAFIRYCVHISSLITPGFLFCTIAMRSTCKTRKKNKAHG